MKTKVIVIQPKGCPDAVLATFRSLLPDDAEWIFEGGGRRTRPQVSEFDDPSLSSGIRSEDAAHIRTAEHSRLQTIVQEAFSRSLQQHQLPCVPEKWL